MPNRQAAISVYLYAMTAASLGFLAAGVAGVLAVLFHQLGIPLERAALIAPTGGLADRLSFSAALSAVALPVWSLHWWLIERRVNTAGPSAPSAEAERLFIFRGLFLAVVLGASLWVFAAAALDLIRPALLALLGISDRDPAATAPAASVAWLLVAATVWVYHLRTQLADTTIGPLTDEAAILPRLYLYLASLGGLIVLLAGATELVRVTLEALLGPAALVGSGAAGRRVAGGTAAVMVGGLLWAVHWLYSVRLLAAPDWCGAGERRSALRTAYLVLVAVVSGGWVLVVLAVSAGHVFRAVLGEPGAAPRLVPDFAIPVLTLAPLAAAWWLHRQWLRDEALRFGGADRLATADRLHGYPIAAFSALLAGAGLGWLIGTGIALVLGESIQESSLRPEAGHSAALVAVGGAAWLPLLAGQRRRAAANVDAESRALIRRAHLLAVLLSSFLAALVSFALALVPLDVGRPLGIFAVASAAIAYSTHLLRSSAAPPLVSTARLSSHAIAALAFVLLAAGTAAVLGTLLDVAVGGPRTARSDDWQSGVWRSVAVAGIGGLAWLWFWMRVPRDAGERRAELTSTSRRLYLFCVFAGGVLTALVAAAIVVYRILGLVLQTATAGNAVSDLTSASGVLLVSVAAIVYHGLVLRREGTRRMDPAAVRSAADDPALPPGAAPARRDVTARPEATARAWKWLVISGPPAADLDAVLHRLAANLPAGYLLERGPPPDATDPPPPDAP